MSDRHIRILRAVAQRRQQQLDGRDAGHADPHFASTDSRHDLQQTAARTRAQLVAAEARRRQTWFDVAIVAGCPLRPVEEEGQPTRVVRIALTEEEMRRFRALCVLRGESVPDRLAELVRAWLAEQEELR